MSVAHRAGGCMLTCLLPMGLGLGILRLVVMGLCRGCPESDVTRMRHALHSTKTLL